MVLVKKNYELILDVSNWLTNGMKEDLTFHTENSERIYDLACDENRWKFWTGEEKRLPWDVLSQ